MVDEIILVHEKDRQDKAMDLVNYYVKWSAGAGLIPFPALDLVAITGIQLKLLSDLSKLYGVPFSRQRGKKFIGALVGGVLPTTLAGSVGSLVKGIPVVGQLLGIVTMPVLAGSSTYALGKVFIQHFESGGTFLDFDPDEVRAYYSQQVEEGKRVVETEAAKAKANPVTPAAV